MRRASAARLALPAVLLLSVAWTAMAAGGGALHEVRLDGTRFVPAEVRVSSGDTVRFVNGTGGPHNIQFMAESIPAASQALLNDAMRGRILPLTSPMFLTEGETYQLVVPTLPPGRYPFLCSPHWATMRGVLIVAR